MKKTLPLLLIFMAYSSFAFAQKAEEKKAPKSIIDLSTRSPKTDRIHGMVDVDLLDASVLVEGPINDDFSFAFPTVLG